MMSPARTTLIWFVSLLLIVFSHALAWGGEQPDLSGVKLIAHRGYHVEAPENSLAAIQAVEMPQ